jgi:hypothetical protein
MTRRLLVAALVAATLCPLAATARADGDPASDVLYFQDVFLPFPRPSNGPAEKLGASVTAANKAGFRIKVAVIASDQDLGSVPSLFGRPQLYAQFLGVELQSFYKDRLLIVMPGGFGIYRGGKAVKTETQVLASIHPGQSADEITEAAATATVKLRKALAKRRKGDSLPPRVKAMASTGHPGAAAKLRYTLADNSGRARVEIRVYGENFLLYATLKQPFARVKKGVVRTTAWKVPAALKPRTLRFCALGADAAGNLSTTSCAQLRITA